MEEFLIKSKEATKTIANLSGKVKNEILTKMSDALLENSEYIISENKKDMEDGLKNNLTSALMDRLLLNEDRVQGMATAIKEIAVLKNPVGRTHEGWIVDNGMNIQKVSVPIGVIGIIYESRPNVTSDTAALCFKSGNICILKGGKEAENSNKAIAKILQEVLEKNNLPKEAISLLPDSSREGVANLIKQDKYVDFDYLQEVEKL